MRGFGDIGRLIVHHSASPLSTTTAQIKHWHTGVRGWSDIGYHYIIIGDGKVEYGRPISKIGAHCRGHNRDSLGVCVVGNNTVPEHKWSMQQVASLQDLVYGLKLVFPNLTVRGHNEYANTLCPGVDVQKLLDEV